MTGHQGRQVNRDRLPQSRLSTVGRTRRTHVGLTSMVEMLSYSGEPMDQNAIVAVWQEGQFAPRVPPRDFPAPRGALVASPGRLGGRRG